ncbi:O-antigen ligase family protein [Vibrio sp. NTOU-M3]|uniref:O-antigen ligase family protein n=1 Tax=Vibrio sp. NTOU-M3 TaxID=3234954 RepID=UPI00349F8154
MYIDNIRVLVKYKINILLSLIFLFITLGLSSKSIPNILVVQKVTLLGGSLFLIAILGLDRKFFSNFFLFTVVSFLCFLLADQHYLHLSFITFIKAYMGMVAFYTVLMIDFGKYIRSVSTSLVILPFLMVPMSLLMSKVMGFSPFSDEGTRFGAGIASAHFAFLMYYVIVLLVYHSIKENRFNIYLYGACLLMMLISGSRGPLLAALFPSLLLLRFLKLPSIKQKILLLSPILAFIIYKFIIFLIARTELETFDSGGGVNLSGREYAWEYFLSKVNGINLFGGGLGSITSITKGVLEYNLYVFVVPHNEFIRFYMELGLIGCTIFFINIAMIFKVVYKSVERRLRSFILLTFLGILLLTVFDNTFSTLQSFIPMAIIIKYILTNERLDRKYEKCSNNISVHSNL